MALFKRANSPFFYVEFELKGQRVRESTSTASVKAAESYERKKRAEVYDQAVLGKTVIQPMTIREAVDKTIETHLRHKKRQKHSADADVYLLDNMIELLGGDDVLISALTTEFIADWRDKLIVGREPAAVNKYLASLKAILRRANKRWKRLAEVPVIELFTLNNKRTRWLTLDEEAQLLKACEAQPHLWNIVLFLLDTGARCSEATRLEWRNVHLEGDGGFVTFEDTKSGLPRSLPLTHRLNTLLKNLKQVCPEGQSRVFLRRLPGCPWRNTKPSIKPVTSWYGAWDAAVEKSKLENLCRHDLRHTYASRLVQKGVPLNIVSQLLGQEGAGRSVTD